jgi:hypothetical protein
MNKQIILQNSWSKLREEVLSAFSLSSYLNKNIGSEKFNICLIEFKNEIESYFNSKVKEVNKLNEDNFYSFIESFESEFKLIKYNIANKYIEEKWIDVVVSIFTNVQDCLHKRFLFNLQEQEKIQTNNLSINKLFNFKELLSFKSKIIPSDDQDAKKYKELTEQSIKNMLEEFNLASIHLLGNSSSWQVTYGDIQRIHGQIAKSMKKVGLPTKNMGCYQNLNLILSNSLFDNDDWDGFQSKTNASFSIFINTEAKDLDVIWIHEYTHFLDRLAAHAFYKEKETDNHLSTFSHIALDCIANGETIRHKPLKIMAEMMAATIGGVSAEIFYLNIKTSIEKLKTSLIMDVVDHMIDYKRNVWEDLSETEKQLILWRSKITEVVNFILLEISNSKDSSFTLNEDEFIISIEGDKKINSGISIKDIVASILEKTNKLSELEIKNNLLPYFYKKITTNINQIMKNHNLIVYKDNGVYAERFFLALGNDIVKNFVNKQANSNIKFSYYDKPLEILARMVESLLNPLISNAEYKNISEQEKKSKLILGIDDRILLCLALHSMARYVGIEVKKFNPKTIPCLIPSKLNEAVSVGLVNQIDYQYSSNYVIANEEIRTEIIDNITNIVNDFFKEEIVHEKRRLI